MLHRRPLAALIAATVGLALLAPARTAAADPVDLVLHSGRTLKVHEVRVGERTVSVTIRKDGGTARMDLPFERLEPRGLLAALDRQLEPADAAGRLRSARLALEFDLRGEAALRFHQAAQLDATLAAERDVGLAAIRALEAADALVDLETRLRRGHDPRGALTLASALLDGPHRGALSSVQVLRVRTLARLARRRVERSTPAAAAAPVAAPSPAAAPAAAALPAETAARLRADEAKARLARAAAADPALSARRAIRHLETAARALLSGRRHLQSAPVAAQAAAPDAAASLLDLLVATYLDLADLYRQAGRFAEARARVRAVLILDPGNEQAWEQRRLIEDDLRADPFDDEAPWVGPGYDSLLYYGYGYPSLLRSPYRVTRYYAGAHPIRGVGGVFGLSFRSHRHHHRGHPGHGTRRVVGVRRTP